MIDSTGCRTVVLSIAVTAAVALGTVLARPRRLAQWLYELAEVLPAFTFLATVFRAEKLKWRSPPPHDVRDGQAAAGCSGDRRSY